MKRALLAIAGGLIVSQALAVPQISPQRIIVNPVETELKVNVWVDKAPNNPNATPDYFPGENIKISTKVNQDAYVYLFNVDPEGHVDLILPNKYASGDNFLKANTTKVFPGENDGFTYEIAAPYGVNKVLALASKTALDLNTLAKFQSNQGFATVSATSQNQLAQKLSIIVKPIPQESWITATAYYNVARPGSTQVEETGNLKVDANVDGAAVYVDGNKVGNTPTTIANLTTGTHNVRITANGYTDYSSTVTIRANQSTNLNVTLRREVRSGNVAVNTNVAADVYLNGKLYGRSDLTVRDLPEGTYTLKLVANGYETYNSSVTVRDGQTTAVNVTLQAVRYSVRVTSNVNGALVFVNGKQAGTIQNGAASFNLAPDNYEIVVIAPGYYVKSARLNLGSNSNIDFDLTRIQ
ncbi:PEGA domain-containing protein [Deinococcus roseus]|uniref:S-layer protein n=1 Tax=Deinococcus roseus TaxID=392414 RepID=A0ABQ2CYK7_9DEIO|nr:PEGA domain-containing protein [Deinococcus roseus]GGJ33601.1 S-layer protein [Deinococcus roseus]